MLKASHVSIAPDILTAQQSLPRLATGGLYRMLNADLRRMPPLRASVNKGKRATAVVPALLPMIVRLLLGGPYLAIHLLKERLAPLVALLVIAN
jgi:hypothetical protein